MVNIQNIDDNECFKWCLVTYLHPADHHPARISKVDKDSARKLDFKGIKFPIKIRDIHKTEKKNCIAINVFGYENKEKQEVKLQCTPEIKSQRLGYQYNQKLLHHYQHSKNQLNS